MTEIKLGKIQSVRFGYGGYQDAEMGIAWTLSGDGWGVGDWWGTWSQDPDKHCKWTREQQDQVWADAVRRLRDTLRSAKRTHLDELVGTPVRVEFDGNTLRQWAVLEEVI